MDTCTRYNKKRREGEEVSHPDSSSPFVAAVVSIEIEINLSWPLLAGAEDRSKSRSRPLKTKETVKRRASFTSDRIDSRLFVRRDRSRSIDGISQPG